jgi:hypothetical protein
MKLFAVCLGCVDTRRMLFSISSLLDAKVAELADAPDLGSGTERCGGSSPPFRTKRQRLEVRGWDKFENRPT